MRLCGNFIVVGVLCRPRIVNSSWIWQSSYQGQLEIPYYLESVDSLNSLYSEHSSSAERSLLLRFGSSVLQAGSDGPTAVTYRRCSHKRSLGPKIVTNPLGDQNRTSTCGLGEFDKYVQFTDMVDSRLGYLTGTPTDGSIRELVSRTVTR